MFNFADIQSIRNAKDNDSLTVFIGAGFSKFAETDTIKFPSWEELMSPFKKDLQTKETDYLKVAQLYAIEFGEYRLYEKLRNIIPLHAQPSPLHELLFRLKPKYVITTNFDNLLEKTIIEKGLIYDVIKSDEDFVKSTLPQKLIKIHGDLDAHNIVFKEDDYLNYTNNRPLLDNFLRHILSSTTVLFLGYSYSDNNIKQIAKWIEKQSKIAPPRFMLKLAENKSEIKYLDNHKIKVIFPNNNTDLNFEKLYHSFFQSIITENIILDNNGNDGSIVDYFYNKLKGLSELNALLPEQIQSLFTNCTIEYHKGCFGLWFHQTGGNGVLTYDYDKSIRELYGRFFEIFEEVKSDKEHKFREKMNFIITCFALANIVFIKHNRNINIYQEYFDDLKNIPNKLYSRDKEFNDFIRFSKTMPKSIDVVLRFVKNNENRFDEMYLFLEELDKEIALNKKSKNFLLAMLNQFNYRNILQYIKIELENTLQDKFNKFFNNYISIDISNYPVKDIKYTTPLLEFVEFKTMYKLHYYSTLDNQTNIQNANSYKNGGFGFDDKEYRSDAYCLILLNFIAGNKISIDNYTEILNLMKSYMTGKIEVQHIKEKFELQNHELFILIKYFKFNDLLNLIYTKILPFVKEEHQEGLGERIIFFSDKEKTYLKETLDNLLVLFKKYSDSFYSNVISNSFINLLLIISLVKWEDSELKEIIEKVNQAFMMDNYPYDFIKSIDRFVLINYKLYKTKNNEFFKFIDTVFLKLIQGKIHHLIQRNVENELHYIYHYGYILSEKYNNLELAKKAINYLKVNFETKKEKRYWAKSLLVNLINISTDDIKTQIADFVKDIRIQDWNNTYFKQYDEIFAELDFLQYGIELDEKFISFLERWIEQLDSSTCTDFELLKQGGIKQVLSYFNFLNNQKQLNQFEPLIQKLTEKTKEIYDSPE